MAKTYYTSRYLIDEHFHAVPNAAMVVDHGKIEAVGAQSALPAPAGAEIVPLGDAVVIPGFINAHCHLELTHIAGQFEKPDTFTEWLFKIRDLRGKSTDEDLDKSVSLGLKLSMEGGVTTMADLTNFRNNIQQFLTSPIRKIYFQEIVGFPAAQAETVAAAQIKRVNSIKTDRLLSVGMAPHSPYAVSPALYKLLYEHCEREDIVFHTHLAEHADEFPFVGTGTGLFRDLLKRFGRDDRKWRGFGKISPVQYLERLGVLKGCMAVHLNYVTEQDVEILARTGAKAVYCPRSSHYFNHENHQVEAFLKAGLEVAIGTDSLASNESLSMLDDLLFMQKTYPSIDRVTILRMLTEYGAKALRLSNVTGKLKPGLEADFAAIGYNADSGDGYDNLFSEGVRVTRTVVAGNTVFTA